MLLQLDNILYIKKQADDDEEVEEATATPKSNLSKAYKEIAGYKLHPLSNTLKEDTTLYVIAHHC